MRSEHCLIYAERSSHNRRSAIMFNHNIILAPFSVLLGSLPQKSIPKISRRLVTYNMIDVSDLSQNNMTLSKQLLSIKFQIVYKHHQELTTSTAHIAYVFNCKNISESIDNLLDNFEPIIIDDAAPKTKDSEIDMSQFLLSSFVVLHLDNSGKEVPNSETVLSKIFVSGEHTLFFDAINVLDDIASVSTPFTNEVFFGTVNVGKVANIFGHNNCLFVASHPLVGGCEGGAVYNRRMKVIGMIICTSFQWKRSQNATLTLVANFEEIVKEFTIQSKSRNVTISIRSSLKPIHPNFNRHVLLIQIGSAGGTGCLVKINNFRFILTCSHVVFTVPLNANIVCFWINGLFTSEVIYKNPNFAQAYDVALLTVPDYIPDEFFVECNSITPVVGDIVYATGFPHFFALAKQPFAPSIFEGRVTKVESGIMFTDASVQAGQSGGPLLNSNGHLVGIMVSNSRDSSDHIYPNVNMCIPVSDIYSILVEFSQHRDVKTLNRLEADRTIVSTWNLKPSLNSKL